MATHSREEQSRVRSARLAVVAVVGLLSVWVLAKPAWRRGRRERPGGEAADRHRAGDDPAARPRRRSAGGVGAPGSRGRDTSAMARLHGS